jgi:hypothetical protein
MVNPLWLAPALIMGAFIAVLTAIAKDKMLFGVDPRLIGFIIVGIAMMLEFN